MLRPAMRNGGKHGKKKENAAAERLREHREVIRQTQKKAVYGEED